MATVLANGSLSSNTGGEGEIRKNLIQNGLVECIVALPKQLFYNTGIPACIWFLRRGRKENTDKILFIDASEMENSQMRISQKLLTLIITGEKELIMKMSSDIVSQLHLQK